MSARSEGGGSAPLAFILASGTILGALWVGAGQPTIEQLIGFSPTGASVVSAPTWQCFWEPTMNQDWHDDVLCVRGLESHRPILLADRAYVTENDMMTAAAEYEATLND
jgi:hypothetical protein